MNETPITVILIVLAAILAGGAWITSPGEMETLSELDDVGELLFPDFSDPLKCTSLEVQSFNPDTGSVQPFKVELTKDGWTIPSHHDYPADARDRITQAATGMIGTKKDAFRTDNPSQHDEFGVLDPLDENLAKREGRGVRFTYKDQSGTVLADLIVGKDVDGKPGFKYVRFPNGKRVYESKLTIDLSTRFEDWIEKDLLELTGAQIHEMRYNLYSLDGTGTPEFFAFTKREDGKWDLSPAVGTDDVQHEKVSNVSNALDTLTLVGVRPKPAQLVDIVRNIGEFPETPKGDELNIRAATPLESGFFQNQDTAAVLGMKGELRITAKDGIAYNLRFGDIAYGTGLELTAGTQKDEEEKKDLPGVNRYVMVTVTFDESYLPEPTPETMPEHEHAEGEEHDPEAEFKANHDAWKQKVDETKARVAELSERFAKWYYVVPLEQYEKVRPKRSDLINSVVPEDKPADNPTDETGAVTTPSGLKYIEQAEGTGNPVQTGDTVVVHYTGTLEDGSKFDSSHDRNEPFEFTVDQSGVIKGWHEGLKGMKAGGKRTLIIPSDLGYGDGGRPPRIPGGATLIFEIELLEIK